MNWNPFKKKPKAERPPSPLQKALEYNAVNEAFKPNRQVRRMSKNLRGTKQIGKKP